MDSERRSLIATALVGLVVLAIIIGSIYYLIQFIRNRQNPSVANQQVTASASPTASAVANASAPVAVSQGSQNAGDFKVYNAGDFQLTYPKGWGILTCTNSQNIELDPTNGSDQNMACGTAVKPITIIKNATGCAGGEQADLGSVKVTRTKATEGNYTRYEWCTKTNPPLYITHRVSAGHEQATSTQDYAKQIEDMISKLSFVHGS